MELKDYQAHALSLNSQGILKLQQRKYSEATALFRNGLELLLVSFQNAPRVTAQKLAPAPLLTKPVSLTPVSQPDINNSCYENQQQCADSDDENDVDMDMGSTPERFLLSVPVFEEKPSSDVDDFFVMFGRALHLSFDLMLDLQQKCEGVSPFCSNVLTAVLLYNIGLTHHYHGLEKCESKDMSCALEYYSLAYTTLADQEDIALSINGNQAVPLHLAFLSLANNMGHIHCYFRVFGRTDICVHEIGCLLSNLVNSRPQEVGATVPAELTDVEYRTFFLNVCFFREIGELAAPAA
ncbi:hypothetical protein FisN_32Hh002 [Fistulifera solaris]|uniref:KIF-binding protein n=1 Tax=Fistulifera solaris TaxID=1519565 RepID=A0A1Z5J5T7_FISSO|nr:hypothetical protein FisN_32Hh002 [Fistulifera solaris]|eukprot:GAX09306.1 hypothetical protein FisN_32Hh002 [Fistulifera solaris]